MLPSTKPSANTQEDIKSARNCMVFFFFSSRRRHTRFDCDWSSDVCSSDLTGVTSPRGSAKSFWNWLHTHSNFAENHAMYSDGWTWYPLTLQTLRRLMSRGQVFTVVRDKKLKACCIFLDEDSVLTMGFAAGEPGDVVKLARMLRFMIYRKKREKLRVLLPSRSPLVRALVRSGFEKTAKILVYEKFLGWEDKLKPMVASS